LVVTSNDQLDVPQTTPDAEAIQRVEYVALLDRRVGEIEDSLCQFVRMGVALESLTQRLVRVCEIENAISNFSNYIGQRAGIDFSFPAFDDANPAIGCSPQPMTASSDV
jgi:hypothetical protein